VTRKSPIIARAPIGAQVSDYSEYPPALPLAGYLLCVWTQAITGSKDEFAQRVLPDGCIDVVAINDEVPMVIGPWTEPFVARLAPGTMIVGARCHPGLAPGLLGLPASELLNQSAPLRAVWNCAETARFERIAGERSLAGRRSAMETALLDRLEDAAPVDDAVRTAIDWLARHPAGGIEKLSRWVGLSSRQLQRRFTAAVGYGPKMFQSVLRFQRLLHLAYGASGTLNLAQAAGDAGYADQAHMTREVRRFSDSTPSVLLRSARSALRLSDLIEKYHGVGHPG
jgi:AraC-like DNA-binding protein